MSTNVRVLDKKQANGAGRVREMIDERFGGYEDWVQSRSGEAKNYPIVLLAVEHDGYSHHALWSEGDGVALSPYARTADGMTPGAFTAAWKP